nr:hypothetical protein CFP56_00221 [Quercus suber]
MQFGSGLPFDSWPLERVLESRDFGTAHDAAVEMSILTGLHTKSLAGPRPKSPGHISRPLVKLATTDSTSTIPISLPSRDVATRHYAIENPFDDSNDDVSITNYRSIQRKESDHPTLTLAEQRTGMRLPPIATGRPPALQLFPIIDEPLMPAAIPLPISPRPIESMDVETVMRRQAMERWTRKCQRQENLKLGFFLFMLIAIVAMVVYLCILVVKRTLHQVRDLARSNLTRLGRVLSWSGDRARPHFTVRSYYLEQLGRNCKSRLSQLDSLCIARLLLLAVRKVVA